MEAIFVNFYLGFYVGHSMVTSNVKLVRVYDYTYWMCQQTKRNEPWRNVRNILAICHIKVEQIFFSFAVGEIESQNKSISFGALRAYIGDAVRAYLRDEQIFERASRVIRMMPYANSQWQWNSCIFCQQKIYVAQQSNCFGGVWMQMRFPYQHKPTKST